jgi:hypothetical protein
VVVGAYGEGSAATGVNGNQTSKGAVDSGTAYVFVRAGSAWISRRISELPIQGPPDFFGGSVAISGDTAVVEASLEDSAASGINGNQADNSATNSGAAYVFHGLPATAPLQNISIRADVLTGSEVLIAGFVISGTGNT